MSNKHINMAYHMPLDAMEKLVLIVLCDHANDNGFCFVGYQALMFETSIKSKSTISKCLHVLSGAGLIEIRAHAEIGEGRKVNTYQITFDESWFEKIIYDPAKSPRFVLFNSTRLELIEKINNLRDIKRRAISTHLEPRKVHTSNPKSPHRVHEPPIEPPLLTPNNINITSPPQKNEDEIQVDPVSDVFNYWQKTMNHPGAVLDDKRKLVITKALKNYTPERLKAAINGCAKSAWHMGQNKDGKVYDSLGLIFRNADKTEGFIQDSTITPKTGANSYANKYQQSTNISSEIIGAVAQRYNPEQRGDGTNGLFVREDDGNLPEALDGQFLVVGRASVSQN
ncbi:helix-turn-helix domain-containing protein [Methylomonas fluvii]|uniref:Helix-turn-helix domain-containing protein n=1 Tax=Methylomonas fluvii TaxID=1854564 RepID=A0ABR9D8Q1_9GAMM|nr:helix-turn-helix domain-containing protein [Methylomonas fluvii]MBD9359473.1 helix-turn-helix domain-containing protein [Methylomonas fluvii]